MLHDHKIAILLKKQNLDLLISKKLIKYQINNVQAREVVKTSLP